VNKNIAYFWEETPEYSILQLWHPFDEEQAKLVTEYTDIVVVVVS